MQPLDLPNTTVHIHTHCDSLRSDVGRLTSSGWIGSTRVAEPPNPPHIPASIHTALPPARYAGSGVTKPGVGACAADLFYPLPTADASLRWLAGAAGEEQRLGWGWRWEALLVTAC